VEKEGGGIHHHYLIRKESEGPGLLFLGCQKGGEKREEGANSIPRHLSLPSRKIGKFSSGCITFLPFLLVGERRGKKGG